jgi:hypothetical protein
LRYLLFHLDQVDFLFGQCLALSLDAVALGD